MKISISSVSGFCMGVKKAIDTVFESVRKNTGNVFIDGQVIHNPQVIELIREKGVQVLEKDTALSEDDILIIRAHGVTPEREQKFRDSGCTVINCTCPLVGSIQKLITKAQSQHRTIVIIGEHGHPEVIGLQGYAQGKAIIIESEKNLDAVPENEPLTVVAQSTQDTDKFTRLAGLISSKNQTAEIHDTICRATRERQDAVQELAADNDAVIVVGGKNSGNTMRLVQIAGRNTDVFHIETEKELESIDLLRYSSIGIAGGASTPSWMIVRVQEKLKKIAEKNNSPLTRAVKSTSRFIVNSNLLTAGSGLALSAAIYTVFPTAHRVLYSLIAVFYIFSMHTLNRFLKSESYTYTAPAKAYFLGKGRSFFFFTGMVSLVMAGIAAWKISTRHLAVLVICSLPGIFYTVRIFPPIFPGMKERCALKDIPGSKDIFTAAGWAFIITLFPVLADPALYSRITIPLFIFILLLTGTRSILLDILDIPGDRICGNDSIPILVGEKNTRRLLTGILAAAASILVCGVSFFSIPLLSLIFLVPIAQFGLITILFSRKTAYSLNKYEALIDSAFILTGCIALLFSLF